MAKDDQDYVRFRCKACGKKLKVKLVDEGGQIISCPRCRSPVNVPLAGLPADLSGGAPQHEGPGPKAGREGVEAPVGVPWVPKVALRHLPDFDKFTAAVEKIDADKIEAVRRLVGEAVPSDEELDLEVRRIGKQQAEEMQGLVLRSAQAMKEKLRELEGPGRPLSTYESLRVRELKASLVLVQAYARHVLRVHL